MNKLSKLLILLLVLSLSVTALAGCTGTGGNNECTVHVDADKNGICDNCETEISDGKKDPCLICVDENKDSVCDVCGNSTEAVLPVLVDYASQLKFNPDSGRAYSEVTVKSYIDGDTTHFNVDTSIVESGVLKARYLGLNTPESTGSIEPWGKKASNYTKTHLQNAVSIIIESDNDTWNTDSTGSRYLVWVWYKTTEDGEYRNLNLEILQEGLAAGSNAASNAYSTYTMGALNQAKAYKLHVFSKEKDPDFYYGGAITLSLKEIKANCEKYEGMLVKFEAVVAKTVGVTIYVEEYDAENDMYFGMQIFAGYNCPILDYFKIGNRVSVIGKLSYYENGDTYQISALKYDLFDPTSPGACQVISTGHESSYNTVTIDQLMNGKIDLDTYVEVKDASGEVIDEVLETKTFDYGELAHYSTVSMNNLKVVSIYTTDSDTDSDGALSITCKDDNGNTIVIRTATMLNKGTLDEPIAVTEADFPAGTVISVKGIIDSFNGKYQIKVFQFKDFTFA